MYGTHSPLGVKVRKPTWVHLPYGNSHTKALGHKPGLGRWGDSRILCGRAGLGDGSYNLWLPGEQDTVLWSVILGLPAFPFLMQLG
jgi:hypothetical protein